MQRDENDGDGAPATTVVDGKNAAAVPHEREMSNKAELTFIPFLAFLVDFKKGKDDLWMYVFHSIVGGK
jgi:hypothetical protein